MDMARPWRILLAGGWYHVVNRGHRRSDLFLEDTDRQRFLGLVAQLPERFGVEVHAFVPIGLAGGVEGGGAGDRGGLWMALGGIADGARGRGAGRSAVLW